jgi:hypothetical protein
MLKSLGTCENDAARSMQDICDSEIPCFRCWALEILKARACNPAHCETLTEWLFQTAGFEPETLSEAL